MTSDKIITPIPLAYQRISKKDTTNNLIIKFGMGRVLDLNKAWTFEDMRDDRE